MYSVLFEENWAVFKHKPCALLSCLSCLSSVSCRMGSSPDPCLPIACQHAHMHATPAAYTHTHTHTLTCTHSHAHTHTHTRTHTWSPPMGQQQFVVMVTQIPFNPALAYRDPPPAARLPWLPTWQLRQDISWFASTTTSRQICRSTWAATFPMRLGSWCSEKAPWCRLFAKVTGCCLMSSIWLLLKSWKP